MIFSDHTPVTTTEKDFAAFVAAIDVSVAGTDEHGDLRWHVECTALANMAASDDWSGALATAKMALDDWRGFYPQLVPVTDHITTPAKAPATITSSPWGKPQTVEVIAPGIYAIETARHGGFYLDPERNAQVPDYFKASTFNRLGESGWYEEDCDWSIPALVFADEFAAKLGAHVVALARQIACRSHTEAFDRFSPVQKAS